MHPHASMPRFTDEDARRIANGLIDLNGQTSTLEVKNALRSEGYFATQWDVSQAMNRLMDHSGWKFEIRDQFRPNAHRVYSRSYGHESTVLEQTTEKIGEAWDGLTSRFAPEPTQDNPWTSSDHDAYSLDGSGHVHAQDGTFTGDVVNASDSDRSAFAGESASNPSVFSVIKDKLTPGFLRS